MQICMLMCWLTQTTRVDFVLDDCLLTNEKEIKKRTDKAWQRHFPFKNLK